MCGICGTANWGGNADLERMNATQRHRGPDDCGAWQHLAPDGSRFDLGSSRLSIIDLSLAGHMPMSNEDGTVWITYTGEIYNACGLRPDLEARGHRFRSHTDTEVIVHLYEEEGVDCLKKLNGMFAFCICDLRGRVPQLFLARDHFGIKPLYYVHRGRRFAFASEAKALLGEEVVELGAVPYAMLHHLYRACDLYVTPAYAETFAHPLVEAMASGLPVIASDLAEHREICGEAALYFACFSPEVLTERIGQATQSTGQTAVMREMGIVRSRDFSWDKHVEELLVLARSIASRSSIS